MAHRFHPKMADKLYNPERHKLLPPNEILSSLEIGGKDVVADIGCGPGFFSIPAARLTTGTVFGVDIEEQMLELLKQNCLGEGIYNVVPVLSDAERILLPDQSVDKIFCAFILHEVESLENTLTEIKRILRPGGRVLVLEWEKKETESGPPLEERLEAEALKRELEKYGFQTRVSRPNSMHYLILGMQKEN